MTMPKLQENEEERSTSSAYDDVEAAPTDNMPTSEMAMPSKQQQTIDIAIEGMNHVFSMFLFSLSIVVSSWLYLFDIVCCPAIFYPSYR